MALNIKNAEACRLAGEVAAMTGQSMTQAIVGALRKELDELQRMQDKDKLIADIMAIVERSAAELNAEGEWDSLQAQQDLYDEHGLPR